MIQAEPIINFNGFGKGNPGEYFYSQGMTKSRFGIVSGWNVASGQSNSDLSTLGLGNFFTQGLISGSTNVCMVDSNGCLYNSLFGLSPYAFLYKPSSTIHGNGILFDQKNRLLYATDRYLGKYDPTASNYTTGAVTLTNGSPNVVGSGTTFTSGMVGKTFQVSGDTNFYRIATFTDATHIVLDTNYNAGIGGAAYTIYMGFDDRWKDFGSAYETSDYRQMDNYEDWVVIVNKNALALLNVTDDSFNNVGLDLPSGYVFRCVRAGRNGILAGLNFNNKGAVLLWEPNYPRAIAPWIWFNSTVQCIVPISSGGWIVITTRGIYSTNGYTVDTIIEGTSDDVANGSTVLANIKPQGAEIIGKYIAFWGAQYGNYNRDKDGLYLLNLTTQTFELAPVYNGSLKSVVGGAIFFDNNFKTHLSYTTATPNKKYIGTLQNSKPASAYLITEQLGNQTPNKKNAEGIKVSLGISSRDIESSPHITFNVTAKIYNFRRPLWGYAQTNNASVSANILRIDGSTFRGVQVGDEITILKGVNAGAIRHVTAIANAGTNTEQWTLDTSLSNNTETNIDVSVSPFQIIKKQTLTDLSEIRDLYFDIKNKIAGKNFLIKIVFDNLNYVTPAMVVNISIATRQIISSHVESLSKFLFCILFPYYFSFFRVVKYYLIEHICFQTPFNTNLNHLMLRLC